MLSKSGHVSFSAMKSWNDCPHLFKIKWDERLVTFDGSMHTGFGTAMHNVAESLVLNEVIKKKITKKESTKIFLISLKEELSKIPEEDFSEKLMLQFLLQEKMLTPLILPGLKKKFGKFEIMQTEERLMESITEFKAAKLNFKGFIDLVIKTDDGKIHIIDWKTCSWGWDARKKSDAVQSYQLTLYKHFYCKKHDVDPKNVETHFALLKRTAKKDNVEIFRVTSGPKKTTNAMKLLVSTCSSFTKKWYPKNKLGCARCELRGTEYCK